MSSAKNKTVMVTGADGGLGVAVVPRLLAAGWHVAAFIHHEENAEKLKADLSVEDQKRLSFFSGDVTLEKDVAQAIAQIKDPVALVHLAGGFAGASSFAGQDEKTFDRMFDLNTRSTFLLLKEIMPVMKKNNDGSIVTIGAKPALHPGTSNAVYAASKAALITLTLTAAEEGRKHHVRANVIVPAVIRTEANLKWASSEEESKKWTAPEDIAEVICWLISEESKTVTGTVIPMYNQISS